MIVAIIANFYLIFARLFMQLRGKLSAHDKEAIKTILDNMILKSRLEEVMPSRTDADWSKQMHSVVTESRKGAHNYTPMS
jgi:hypothetical protein